MRPVKELIPEPLAGEFLRVAKLDRNWVRWECTGKSRGNRKEYKATTPHSTWLNRLWFKGVDAFGMWASSVWLLDGPKVFAPTAAQCASMEQIEVGLELHEYAQPYPALMVDFSTDRYAPFECILCHSTEGLLTCYLLSTDHADDIVTTIAASDRPIEESINYFDADCSDLSKTAAAALRVALNACLCLMNFGCKRAPQYPKQLENDRKLAAEQSERGAKARFRVKTAVQVVSFEREVVLHDRKWGPDAPHSDGDREVCPHWRRGHWRMARVGQGGAERRRVLVRPCMVRPDKFVGDTSDTTTIYHT